MFPSWEHFSEEIVINLNTIFISAFVSMHTGNSPHHGTNYEHGKFIPKLGIIKAGTLLQLATKFRLKMMHNANFVPSWDEVKSIVNLATLFEPAFSTCDQHGHKLVLDLNFGPTWSEVINCIRLGHNFQKELLAITTRS